MRRLLIALFVLACCLPTLAPAAPVTWMVPAGGETWTAGSQHTIAWAGGSSTVVLTYHPLPLSMVGYVIGAYFPNTGYITFNIPTSTPAGQYVLQIGFSGPDASEGSYSAEFTIAETPQCLIGCTLVSASMAPSSPWTGQPPNAICGNSAAEAGAVADAFITSELGNQCFAGYSLDPGSLSIDVTYIPIAVCYAGYFGPYYAEATGFGCCCPDAVPVETQSFGSLKARYF